MSFRSVAAGFTAIALLLLSCQQAQAVIVSGTGNDTAPTDGFSYFDNVVYRGSGSAIYLGDFWVLTAHHVGVGDVVIGGTTYRLATGSGIRIKNPDGTDSDMDLFRITTDPMLPSITLSTRSMQYNDTVRMIGYGWNRQQTQQQYDSAWNSPPQTSTAYTGFNLTAGTDRTKRWGDNKVSTQSIDIVTYSGSTSNGRVRSFATTWDASAGVNEAQATIGDSGGGAFMYRPSTQSWHLVGMIHAVAPYPNQPWDVYVYGNQTYVADISYYRNSINAAMGESLWGDFNADRIVDALDIDLLRTRFGYSGYDLNHDWLTNSLDVDYLVQDILQTNYGDADLNGQVDLLDLTALARSYGLGGGWASGDFDGNGVVDLLDLTTLARNYGKGTITQPPAAAVPEPISMLLMGGAMLGLLRRRRSMR